MTDLRYTLVSDGSSDKALVPILTWLLEESGVTFAIQSVWADLGRLPRPPRTLRDKIEQAIDLYPCDLLFVHRDAENQGRKTRVREIGNAVDELAKSSVSKESPMSCYVCVVPVRMTEAWLLFDEAAIKRAAGNASSQEPLGLPNVQTLETLLNPKDTLRDLLKHVSGLSGRRLQQFRVGFHAQRVSGFIADFSPLRTLQAFKALENELRSVIKERQWDRGGHSE